MASATFDNPPNDPMGAFCRENHAALEGSGSGPLAGLTFAAKDVFDIAGSRTGFGSPTWLNTHPPAEATAPAVQMLLDAGANMVGKVLSDELTYSLSGQNAHYGTPVNPAAPRTYPRRLFQRISFRRCRWTGGLRPRYRLRRLGTPPCQLLRRSRHPAQPWPNVPRRAWPLSPGVSMLPAGLPGIPTFLLMSAVCCWTMAVQRAQGSPLPPPRRLLFPSDAFGVVDVEVADALAPAVELATETIGSRRDIIVSEEGLMEWFQTFRVIQAWEIWSNHREWVQESNPRFGPGIRERMEWASRGSDEQAQAARARRDAIVQRVRGLFEDGDVLCLPTSPRVAPPLDTPQDELEDRIRAQAMMLLCIAGLAGLPQVSMPLATLDGLPLGFSVVGPWGSDSQLLELSRRIMARA